MVIKCPHCGVELEAESEHLGMTANCANCQQKFVVTAPENPNLISCPDCGDKVSRLAVSCPHCGRPLLNTGKMQSPLSPPTAASVEDKQTKMVWVDVTNKTKHPWYNPKLSWTSGCLVVVIIFILIIFAIGHSESNSPDEKGTFEAWHMSQQFIKERLKSPTSAEFPAEATEVKEINKNHFWVKGYVDAKNSFGVPLRHNFTASLEYCGKSQWRCIDLNITEN